MAVNLANLVAWYDLDDATDAHTNGIDLTNSGGVTFPALKVGNGANFVRASSQSLGLSTYNANLNLGTGDWTIAFWFRRTTTATFPQLMGMGWDETPLATKALYTIYARSDNNRFEFQWYNGGYLALPITTLTLANSTWYFAVVKRSGTTITASINARAHTASTTGGLQATTDGTFALGRGNFTAGSYFDGDLDSVGFWKGYAITNAEEDELYNSGNGVSYADIAGAPVSSGFFNFF